MRLSTRYVAILLCTLSCYLSAGAHTNNATVSEKILKVFNETYTNAQQVSWHEKGDQFSVSFLQSEIRYIVNYNNDAHVTSFIRFYNPALLPANILLEIKKRYSAKTAFGVTEITSGEALTYFVKMEDAKYLYTVKLDTNGNGRVYEKLRKQQ